MEFDLPEGEKYSEHYSVGSVDISKVSAMKDTFFFGPESI